MAGTAAPAVAQTQARVYGQAGVAAVGHRPALPIHRVSPALEGWTPAVMLAAGVHVSPRWSIQADATVERTLSGAQQFRYSWVTDYTAQSRDVLLGATVRWRTPTRVPVELAVGGGGARSTFRQVDSVTTYPLSGGRTETAPDREQTVWAPTAHASLAFALPAGEAVELVPSIGVRWVRRPAESMAYEMGVGRVAVLTSLALRFGAAPVRQ